MIAINFISSEDNDEERVMIIDKANEVTEELFQSLISRYQIRLETSMIGSGFFDCAHLLYHKFHKTNFKRGGSYVDSPDWIKNKKATINPIDKKDNKCFQYALAVVLNHEEIKKGK